MQPVDKTRASYERPDIHVGPLRPPNQNVNYTVHNVMFSLLSTSSRLPSSLRVIPRRASCTWPFLVAALATGCDGPVDPEPAEHRILTVLYHELGGPGWEYSDNWLTDAPLDSWYGVATDSEGNVTGLSLGGNGLKGRIPARLGMLTALRNLDLGGNLRDGITGAIPAELGNLRHLERLDLRFNQLTGSIPPELGDLHDLAYLSLAGNHLTGSIPPELGNLGNLHTLNLMWNTLDGAIPPELGKLARLTHLYLSGNALTGAVPPELGDLRSLGYLAIDNTTLSGRLPMELTDLRLGRFYWHDTDLCSPPDEEFQEWLAKIFGRKGMGKCGS